jgi:hypothetical protein
MSPLEISCYNCAFLVYSKHSALDCHRSRRTELLSDSLLLTRDATGACYPCRRRLWNDNMHREKYPCTCKKQQPWITCVFASISLAALAVFWTFVDLYYCVDRYSRRLGRLRARSTAPFNASTTTALKTDSFETAHVTSEGLRKKP